VHLYAIGFFLTLFSASPPLAEYHAQIDGALLLAGGEVMLVEKAEGFIREPPQLLKTCAAIIFKALRAIHKLQHFPDDGYWDSTSLLAREYGDVGIGIMLQDALMLWPREAIRFTFMLCDNLDVPVVDGFVKSQRQHGSQYLFKVVSVADVKAPRVVRKNFVYGVDDAGKWCLLTSVDLQHHGSAPPGHWHINRSPHGDVIPHYHGIGGKQEGTFHGDPASCPIWWHLIPVGCMHLLCPDRPFLWERCEAAKQYDGR